MVNKKIHKSILKKRLIENQLSNSNVEYLKNLLQKTINRKTG